MIKFIFLLTLFGFFISISGILVNYILFECNILDNEEIYEKVFKICIIILSAAIILGGLDFLLSYTIILLL